MTRESLQLELKKQQEHLDRLRKSFHIDQNHPMLARADDIQKQINEINDDICQYPDAVSYGSINDGIIRHFKSQIDWLKRDMIVRN